MAHQLASRTSSVCSKLPYSDFLCLKNFAPAVEFCTIFESKYAAPPVSACHNGDTLCKVLSSLSKCDRNVITTACSCIGVTPKTSKTIISIPPTTKPTTKPATKTTTPAPTTTTSACPTPTTCTDGVIAVCPPPADAICQQPGTLDPRNWDILSDPSATSVEACAALCLNTENCATSEFDPETQDCQMFAGSAATEGFVPVPGSVFVISDNACFVAC